jgi:hypothetical protein
MYYKKGGSQNIIEIRNLNAGSQYPAFSSFEVTHEVKHLVIDLIDPPKPKGRQ